MILWLIVFHILLLNSYIPPSFLSLSICSRQQQYECKWYIPLADLTFQTLDDSDSCPSIQILPEHEIEEMKIKISVLKSDIQKEKVILLLITDFFYSFILHFYCGRQ